MGNRSVAADLAAVAGACAVEEEALGPVDRADRVEHRQRGLGARTTRHLALREARPRVALEQDVREVSPLGALADQFDLGGALDCHLVLYEAGDRLRRSADELGERRAAVAEHPRIAVLV